MRIPSNIIIDLVFGLFFLLTMLAGGYDEAPVLVPVVMIAYHILKIWLQQKSIELSFLLVFSITYPLFWLIAVGLNVDIHYLFWNVSELLVAKALSAQGLFLCCLFIGMRNQQPLTIAQHPRRNSAPIFWICIAGMVLSLIIAVRSIEGSIFQQSYDYEISRSSIIFEYILILIIIAYAYSGKSKFRRFFLIAASLIFVLTPLYFGKRLPASMVAFAVLILFWRPKSFKQVFAIFFSGFLALSILAVFRVGESDLSIVSVLLNIGDQEAMRNNQGGVVYSSAAYMKLVEQGAFDISFGIQSMFNVALSVFLPSSMVDQSAYINLTAMKYIPIPGNGGLPGVGFYVWGGIFMVIAAGVFLGRLMARSRHHYLSAIYISFIFFTFPRWMAYNINIMVKGGLLVLVGWLFVRFFIRLVSARASFQQLLRRN